MSRDERSLGMHLAPAQSIVFGTTCEAHSHDERAHAAERSGRERAPEVERLARFLREHPQLFVLTGAGVSEPSGIPVYRDGDGNWLRPTRPITHQEFLTNAAARQRYWARSMLGWPAIACAQPNAAHLALAALERRGGIARLVTQNVDGLHQRAGSECVEDLHGRLAEVVCLDCGASHERAAVQLALEQSNPRFATSAGAPAPDGDAGLEDETASFQVPLCEGCGGTLKPDVVFFGASVPLARVERVYRALDDASAVLVVGSSLAVYSGYRFCVRAHEQRKPIVAINRGRTRADALLELKIEADCERVLRDAVGSGQSASEASSAR